MDPDVSRWVAEFLLRSSVPDSLAAKTLAALPLSSADPRLKKTLLLRTLQSQLSHASITETALEIIELLEQIDRNDAVPLPHSIRSAYCAVAVECTVRYLAASPDDSSGEYFSAVSRIWRGRVAEAERRRSELFSGAMDRWRNDIEAALLDPRVSGRLANLNTRNDAFNELRLYLKEAWGTMGPTFLDSVAAMSNKGRKKKNKGLSLRSLGADPVRAVVAEGCSEPVMEHGDDDAGGGGGGGGGDDHVDDDAACGMEGTVLNGVDHGKEQLEERGEGSFDLNHEPASGEKVSPLATKKDNLPHQHKHPALRRCHRGVTISGCEELDSEKSSSKNDHVPSAEVKKARESLKSSSMELRTLVKDPLPDALNISEVVRSELAMKNSNHEPPIENQSGQLDVPNSNTCRSIVLYQPKDANLWKSSSVRGSNVHLEKKSSAPRSKVQVQRPNIMTRNSSARSYEWDDSIDNMPQGMPPRRKKRKWTPLEEETLRTGVKMFGEGNWATIRSFYSNIFENRRGVDLKDKWRNMIR